MAAIPQFDRGDIIRTWQTFREPGEVTELRCLGKEIAAIQGYYNDPKAFATACIALQDERAEGYYFVLNPVNEDLFSRAANTYVKRGKLKGTTGADIITRKWLPIDCDSERKAGISATDEEHEAALQKAQDVQKYLSAQGWPVPVQGDSGNGAHLVYRINLPNDDESTTLVTLFLKALATRFTDEAVKIDTAVFDPNRIWKIYGTTARKGSNTTKRPHRLARIVAVPNKIGIVTKDQIEAIIRLNPPKDDEVNNAEPVRKYSKSNGHIDDMGKWLTEHGITWEKTKAAHKNGLMYVMKCPVCGNTDNSCEVSAYPPPKDGYHATCHHETCTVKSWADFRKKVEPGYVPYVEKIPDPTQPKDGKNEDCIRYGLCSVPVYLTVGY
jgi:hypothetical protein